MRNNFLFIAALFLCSCAQNYEKLLTDNSTKLWLRQEREAEAGIGHWGFNALPYVVLEFNQNHSYRRWFCFDRRDFQERIDLPDVTGVWSIDGDQIILLPKEGKTDLGDNLLKIASIEDEKLSVSSISNNGEELAQIEYVPIKL